MIWLEKGKVFKEDEYLETLDNLQQLYADRGYIYITVEPQRDIVDQTVNVDFTFIEGQPAKIHDIQISGNTKTYDKVILREMRIFPGDTFSNTPHPGHHAGHFPDRASSRTSSPTSGRCANGDVDMILKVKEKQTGQFMFGMAYSAETSASGFIQVAETNFQGKGQNMGVTWQFGSRQRYVDISFTEPWFLGTPTLVGRRSSSTATSTTSTISTRAGSGASACAWAGGFPGTRYSRVGLRYELSETRLRNFSPSYIDYLDDLEESLGTSDLPWQRLDKIDWPQTKSSIRLTFNRNSHRQPVLPHRAGRRPGTASSWPAGPWAGKSSSRSTCCPIPTTRSCPADSPCICGDSSA